MITDLHVAATECEHFGMVSPHSSEPAKSTVGRVIKGQWREHHSHLD